MRWPWGDDTPAFGSPSTDRPLKHLLLIATLLAGGAKTDDDMPVPVALQADIFVKVLNFDRALQGDTPLRMGVLYQPKARPSSLAKEELVAALTNSQAKIQGRTIELVPIVAGSPDQLSSDLDVHAIDVLYVTPLRAVDVSDYAAVTRPAGVRSISGVPRFIRAGIAIGVGLEGSKPNIIINAEAARAEGAQLQARLMKLAQLVEED